jgi:hypothetical protein
MQIRAKIIPKSSLNIVMSEMDGSLRVKLTAPPEKGKANEQLVEILAKHYNIKKSKIRILKGHTSHEKILEIEL